MPRRDGTGPAGRGPGTGRGMGGRGGGMGTGGGRGRMGGPYAAGPEGVCVCPSCEAKAAHAQGVPCASVKCPKCGSAMTRGQ